MHFFGGPPIFFFIFFWFSFENNRRTNVFSSKTKNTLFWGSKIVVFKTQISNFFLRLLFIVKGSFMPIFTKEYSYLGPLEFFENDNFAARALVGGARRIFGFGLLKSYLTFGYLTCSDWSKKCPNSTLMYIHAYSKFLQCATVSSILLLNILPFFTMTILNICIFKVNTIYSTVY